MFIAFPRIPALCWGAVLCALLLNGGGPSKVSAKPPVGKVSPSPSPTPFVLPETVATVNGTAIRRQEIEAPAETMLSSQGRTLQSVSDADKQRIYRSVLEDVIIRRLVASQAAADPVPDEDVDKQMAVLQGQFPNQEAFEADLKKNSQTAEQLRAAVRMQLSQQHWVEQQIAGEIKVAPGEVEQFYKAGPPGKFDVPEAVHASHLLVAVRKDAPPEDALDAENKANDLAARVKKGESFEELVKQDSDDTRTKASGGDLGFLTRAKVMPAFADAAFKLKKGEVGGPVRTLAGYHLIKVLDRQPAHTASLDEVRDQVAAYLESTRRQAAAAKLIQGLRDNAKVEIFLAGQP